MREERFPWGVGALLALLIVGGIGFWLGSSSVAPVIVPVTAPVAAPAQQVPVYPAYVPQSGGGFPFFGLLFGLFVLVVVVKIARHAAGGGYNRRRAWSAGPNWSGGPSWSGKSSWSNTSDWSGGPADEMFQRWHRRVHGESPEQQFGERTSDAADQKPSDAPPSTFSV